MPTEYTDGSFTTAAQNGDVVVQRPFLNQGVPNALVITRPMIVARANYSATALDAELAGFAGSKLVEERDFEDAGLGIMTFNQIYATIPGGWTEPAGSQVYEFPAILSGPTGGPFEYVRQPFVKLSPVRIVHLYQAGSSFALPSVFQPKLNSYPVRFVSADTSPTKTAYETNISNGDYLVIDAKPKQYMGNIYEIERYEILAQ